MANVSSLAMAMILVAAFAQGANMRADGSMSKEVESIRVVSSRGKAEARLRLRAKKELQDSSQVWVLMLSIQNTSQWPLFAQETYSARDYMFDVKDESGDKVSLSEAGKRAVLNDSIYKNVGMEIPPGGSLNDKVYLNELYDLSVPGNYVVTASRKLMRKDGSEFEIKSNTIKLEITP